MQKDVFNLFFPPQNGSLLHPFSGTRFLYSGKGGDSPQEDRLPLNNKTGPLSFGRIIALKSKKRKHDSEIEKVELHGGCQKGGEGSRIKGST